MSATIPPAREVIAANLRAELDRHQLSVFHVALALGQHERTVRRWRTGVSEPQSATVYLLAEFFGRKPAWFYEHRAPVELELIAAGHEPGGAPEPSDALRAITSKAAA